MKTFKLYFLILAFVPLFWNCEGDPGPAGPPGPIGPEGDPAPLALEYEVEFTLNSNNNWSTFYDFPQKDLDLIYPTDMALVYMLWDIDGDTDIWRLMPVNYFYPEGMVQVNYDFSMNDVRLFAEGSYPLNSAQHRYENLLARIIIIPAEMSANQRVGNVDFTDYEEVKKAYHLKDIQRAKGRSFKDNIKK
jgi:hypothetical protein